MKVSSHINLDYRLAKFLENQRAARDTTLSNIIALEIIKANGLPFEWLSNYKKPEITPIDRNVASHNQGSEMCFLETLTFAKHSIKDSLENVLTSEFPIACQTAFNLASKDEAIEKIKQLWNEI